MTDPNLLLTLAASGLAGLAMATLAGLKGWQGWLEFKRAELASRGEASPPSASSRIEVADLKERVRKLEQIAAGVDI